MKPNPILRLTKSSKALVMFLCLGASLLAVYYGRMTWGEVERFLTVVVPAWMIAVGIEDAAKHNAAGKHDGAVSRSEPPKEGDGG